MKRVATNAAYAAVAFLAGARSAFAATGADAGAGIFNGVGTVSGDKLRSGDIGFDDVPVLIMNVTKNLLAFSGTVAVIMIIYGAFKLSLGSASMDKDTAKKIIVAAIIGFVLSVSGYAIVKIIIANLTAVTA